MIANSDYERKLAPFVVALYIYAYRILDTDNSMPRGARYSRKKTWEIQQPREIDDPILSLTARFLDWRNPHANIYLYSLLGLRAPRRVLAVFAQGPCKDRV